MVYTTTDDALVTVSPHGAVHARRLQSAIWGLAVERRGTVLVSDLSPGMIDRVNLTTNRVTTFGAAGSGRLAGGD